MKRRLLVGILSSHVVCDSVRCDTGLLSQWLIEGKFTEEEVLSQSYDMLSAGIDTVNASYITLTSML